MTRVEEINDIAGLARHREAWNSLHAQTEDASFFQSLDWLETYWRHYGAGQKLRTLIVTEGGEPTGILPLVVLSERHKVGMLRVLTYPLSSWGSFYGPLGADPEQTLAAGWDHLARGRRDWDMIEPRFLRPGDAAAGLTRGTLRRAGFSTQQSVWDQTALIDLTGSFDQYLSTRTKKWRTNYRRWQRLLDQRGEVNYLRYRPQGERCGDGDPRWDLYDSCEEIARRSWQGSSPDGTTLSHAAIRPFLRDVHAAAARCGAVDINLLLLDGRPAAFIYAYQFQGSVFGLRMGFDPDFSREGIGNLLYMQTIRDSFDRGDRTFDMGPGSLDAKKNILSRIVPILRHSHYHVFSPRAQLLRLKRWACSLRPQAAANETGAVECPAESAEGSEVVAQEST